MDILYHSGRDFHEDEAHQNPFFYIFYQNLWFLLGRVRIWDRTDPALMTVISDGTIQSSSVTMNREVVYEASMTLGIGII